MTKRRPVSKKKSRKDFTRGQKTKSINNGGSSRGGIRF
jgi:hypothetical protein